MKCLSSQSIPRSVTILLSLMAILSKQATGFTTEIFPTIKSLRGTARHSASRSNPRNQQLLVNSVSLQDSPPSSTSAKTSSSPFENFDYNAHWYPVSWARDLILNEPTKVTVFDVDYVVARISETEVICMQDQCPHKAAALSQGRVTTTGNFQCAYHGWAFDGKTGKCVDIPQIAPAKGSNSASSVKIPSRACGQAVPAQIVQEMVWIFPGGNMEEALQAPPPPRVPEYDELGFKMTTATRDMPVDWPILVSNICDPDHGLFAHQAKPFDMYTASPEFPMEVEEYFPDNGKSFVLKSKVDSAQKVLKVDETFRGRKKTVKNKKDQETPWATASLTFPNHLQLKRVQKDTNSTSFVSAFYICPVGVGRSRFMSAGVSKSPPPRWMTKLFLDNFLDQDTYLLATQQHYILQQEAEDIEQMLSKDPIADVTNGTMSTRRNMFCLCSPTERFGSRVEQFWDATLLRSPNRIQRLLQLRNAGAFATTPSREFVLDRKTQHLDVVPDSQDVVRNCERISRVGNAIATCALVARLLTKRSPAVLTGLFAASFLASFVSNSVKKEYYFKYTEEMRRKDMKNIPKQIWLDR